MRRAAASAPVPSRRKRSGKDEGTRRFRRMFRKAARRFTRRRAQEPTPATVRATLYLADTLDWLTLWQDNAASFEDEPTQALDFPALRF